MERPLDVRAFLKEIHAQKKYERPLEGGQYLGFLIQGEQVVLKRIEELTKNEPVLVACPVRRLFE